MLFNAQLLRKLPELAVKLLTILLLMNLQACLSPMAMDYTVIEYDKTTTNIISKQLLLNIARTHQHLPMHFTAVSNIAATFNFQFNAGATPAATGDIGGLITPIFGGTVSESPTISIVPIEGEQFTQRLLTPFHENKLSLLLRQGADVDLLLRMLSKELRISGKNKSQIFLNSPSHKDGYTFFRQTVSHLSSIQDKHHLYAEPLIFFRKWTLPVQALDLDKVESLQKDFVIDYQPDSKNITLTKREVGGVILTNYDPSTLSNEERNQLNLETNQSLDSDVLVDIRPGYPGGDHPIHGYFRLRSFSNVINFIGRSISDSPEFDVPVLAKSKPVSENPASTLGVIVSKSEPDDAHLSVKLGDYYYSIKPEKGYQWNRDGFRLLYFLFQMTVTDIGQQGAPLITIAK